MREPRQIRNLQIDPSDGTLYLLGNNSGMLVSKHGGEAWSMLGNPPAVERPPTPPGESSLGRTGGSCWLRPCLQIRVGVTPASQSQFQRRQHLLLPQKPPATPPRLIGSWKSISDLPRQVNVLVADHTNPKLIFAGTGSGVYKSEDGGLSWKASSSGLNNLSVTALAFSTGKSPVLFAASDSSDEIYASADQGQTWSLKGKSGIRAPFGGGLFPSLTDAKVIYYISTDGSARSEDRGQTWQQLGDGLPQDEYHLLVMTIVFDPTNPKVIYAGTGGFVGQGQGVYKSEDGGETWSPCNMGMLDYRITGLAVDPKNPQIVYAGSESGDLFKSSDGGLTWTNLKDRLVKSQYGEPRDILSVQMTPLPGSSTCWRIMRAYYSVGMAAASGARWLAHPEPSSSGSHRWPSSLETAPPSWCRP